MKKKEPIRTCIVTKKKLPKRELARFVYNKDNDWVYLDQTGKVPGRGANLTVSMEVFEKAVSTGAFKRAFKKNITSDNIDELRADFEVYLKKLNKKNKLEPKTVRVQIDKVNN